MKTVLLLGELGRKFGRSHRFDVRTPAEAIRALIANFPGFERELIDSGKSNVGYRCTVNEDELSEKEFSYPLPREATFTLAPEIMGAGATGRIIGGVALLALAAVSAVVPGAQFATGTLVSLGAGLILGGVVDLLSPQPKTQEPPEAPDNQPSYSFNGPVNTNAQGQPVPVGYGRLIIGGALVSAGLSTEDISI